MFSAADLPDTLPIFPLAGALVLPRGRLPLHIFEPRYLAMFDDALKTNGRLIGMVQPLERPDGATLHAIGCAGRITSFTETDDNRYMVTLSGVSRFRIGAQVEGFTPYLRHQVDWSSFERDLGKAERDPALNRDSFLALLARYFDVAELQTDWDSLKEAEDELLINSLSMMCPFDPEDKQALLEAPSLEVRRETLVTLMEFALRGGTGEERVQ
ncbi:LON peptidase substrate-binding domain-containing protein [Aliiroseovarius subalbicans]|uniref:LON peptidase substrate-binding domain-containing protein n=1 Tax=Aliiroseovarius subalbicans TaxID=2925840 RepID=UPI001F59B5EE|nr:LON peptidase substrate-binding domain-containing protein [Aliiroseovarius subalbicans]MCI2400188.1 LON peptidase substrate-binding domain-containing protein [Aliiroseovarius subalbicans]